MEPVTVILPLLSWILLVCVSIIAVFLGLILSYHWYRYAMSPTVPTIATTVYALGVVFLLILLTAAAFAV